MLKTILTRTGNLGLSLLLGVAAMLSASTTLAQTAYIPGVQPGDGIRVFNTTTNTVTTTIATPGAAIQAVGVNFAGTRAYFTDISTNPGTLLTLDTSTNTFIAPVTLGQSPVGVAVNPAGTRLYVADSQVGEVRVLNAADNALLATVSGISNATALVVKGDGTKVYVSTFNGVAVIDTASLTTSVVGLSNTPRGIAIDRTGAKVYAALANGRLATIDTVTNAVVYAASGSTQLRGIAVSPDGAKVYAVSTNTNRLAILDTATNTVTSVTIGNGGVGAGSGASLSGVSMTQDGAKVVITSRESGIYVFNTSTLTSTSVASSGDLYSLGQFIAPPAPIIAPAAAVPTITEWAMILFGLILAGGAALYIQRRQLIA